MKRMKTRLAWCVVNALGIDVSAPYDRLSSLRHLFLPAKGERIARVEIREVPRKPRARRTSK